jgi:hypothetical protein
MKLAGGDCLNPLRAGEPSPCTPPKGEVMTRNVGTVDRLARAIVALGMFTGAVTAPLSLGVRLAAFLLPAVVLMFTALSGRCLGYRLMGKSTCPAPRS